MSSQHEAQAVKTDMLEAKCAGQQCMYVQTDLAGSSLESDDKPLW